MARRAVRSSSKEHAKRRFGVKFGTTSTISGRRFQDCARRGIKDFDLGCAGESRMRSILHAVRATSREGALSVTLTCAPTRPRCPASLPAHLPPLVSLSPHPWLSHNSHTMAVDAIPSSQASHSPTTAGVDRHGDTIRSH